MKRFALIGVVVLASAASAQDMPLSQVLIPGEGVEAGRYDRRAIHAASPIHAVTADEAGNPVFAPRDGGVWTLTKDGPEKFAAKASVTAMCWGPEGTLLTIEGKTLYRRSPGAEPKKVADGVFDVAVSPKGAIYYTVTAGRPGTIPIYTFPPRRAIRRVGLEKPIAEDLLPAAGLCFWRDGGTLVVGDAAGDKLFAYRVGKGGGLDAPEGYYTLRTRGREPSGVKALTLDTDGRLYAATALGVQVFDPTGRMCGVLEPPARHPVTALAFAGPGRDTLYVVCDGKLFARKTRVKGFVPAAKKPGPKGPG